MELLEVIIQILCILLLAFAALYAYVTNSYSYWKDRGVPHITPTFPFGSSRDVVFGRIHFGHLFQTFYNQFKGERYFGVYDTRKPNLIVRDPELIKHVLIKDFHHFSDRFVIPINQKKDYILLHLFNMTGQEWKKMRSKLSPTFTSGKMKGMFLLMVKCTEQLRNHVDKEVSKDPVIDVKDVLARFTLDIIATCAFGLEINSQSDDASEFYYYRTKLFKPSTAGSLKRVVFSALPFLAKIFPIQMSDKEVSDFFTKIVRDTVEYREKNNINRNDFLELLLKIRKNTSLMEDDKQLNEKSEEQLKTLTDKSGLTIEQMTAQAFIFIAAGFETASSTMTFCLYELARNPEIQETLYQEVKEVLVKHGGPTYQALQEMPYMDQVINETLRLYASLSILNRTCTEKYRVPNSNLVLEKGQRITIPIYAIHHDPEYYPEPHKFDPERFTEERIRERHPCLHLPFGEGPRMCIGMRFGLLQTKIGLAEMLSNFHFGISPKTEIPITIHKRAFVTTPEKPIQLHLTRRISEF